MMNKKIGEDKYSSVIDIVIVFISNNDVPIYQIIFFLITSKDMLRKFNLLLFDFIF